VSPLVAGVCPLAPAICIEVLTPLSCGEMSTATFSYFGGSRSNAFNKKSGARRRSGVSYFAQSPDILGAVAKGARQIFTNRTLLGDASSVSDACAGYVLWDHR